MDRQYTYFRPKRAAAWITTIDDLLWPDINIIRKIERMAKGFADAGVDLAINYGFHTRFDFSDYFETLNGYYKNVCDELHKYGIRFMEHYSCNLVERPKPGHLYELHNSERHHVLLHKDPIAAEFAQYAGHRFRDLVEKDVRDGSNAYCVYKAEMFCHNNPGFIDMHRKYLERMLAVVPLDAMEVDDMCDYGGLTSCGCDYCRERFRRDYGRELPPLEDRDFWGDTSKPQLSWGNYDNPAFRDWVRCKTDGVHDHIRMIKEVLGDRPLMTCCSGTGPMVLNGLGLNLERFADDLDLVMLENCGMALNVTNWAGKDAEAMLQKDIAANTMGGAPAVALSYQTYEPSAYLGWALARFWGAANWGSTMVGRLSVDPGDIGTPYDLMAPTANWEDRYSPIPENSGEEAADIRIANNLLCRENGHRDENGREHWKDASGWSRACVEHNVGYRFVRFRELSDAEALLREKTPLVLANMGVVSDAQFEAIEAYLAAGGRAILKLPFGTRDEQGFLRPEPLSAKLLAKGYAGLTVTDADAEDALSAMLESGVIRPAITQTEGETTWAMRLRRNDGRFFLHILNRALKSVPHPTVRVTETHGGGQIIADIEKTNCGGRVSVILRVPVPERLELRTPERGRLAFPVETEKLADGGTKLTFDLSDITLYAVVQEKTGA
ncbi:MAG: alpha-amylase family protein [Eubacteriales bacterium]|nr:alpha-amylase family protein [Eubacteriales bacterium]